MKRGTPRHPKIYDLLAALDLPVRSRAAVIGYLELLWHFTAEFAPQGDIGKFSDDRIEGACDWTGKRGKLIEALTTAKWCDKSDLHRLIVHDWHEHADDSVKKKLARAGLKFLSLTEKVTGDCLQPGWTSADNGRLPLPVPEPVPEPEPRVPLQSRPFEIEDWFEERFREHPNKRDKMLGKTTLSEIPEVYDPKWRDNFTRIHRLWCASEGWRWKQGARCPKFWEWIRDEGWRYEPPEETTGSRIEEVERKGMELTRAKLAKQREAVNGKQRDGELSGEAARTIAGLSQHVRGMERAPTGGDAGEQRSGVSRGD